MATELIVHAHYRDTPDNVFARARNFAAMIRASWPLTLYKGLPRTDMEQGRTYVTDISVLGFIRLPGYRIEIKRLDNEARFMETQEGSQWLNSWHHLLTVHPQSTGSRWTDRLIIDAGAATFRVSHFARLMYMRRHKSRGAKIMGAYIRQI